MSIDLLFIHTATINRPTHTLAGGKKIPGQTTGVTTLACRLEPAGDTPQATMLGITASEAWRAWFPSGSDIRLRDEVVWTSRSPSLTFTVEADLGWPEENGAADHHLELLMKRKTVG